MEIERIRPIKTAKAEQIDSLPEEIIEEILSRLPVKSLLKFRCVSKSWCSLIGSKHFTKAHLEKSKKNTNFTHHRIVLISSQPVNSIKQCSLYSLLNEPVTNSFEFDYPIYTQAHLAEVVGCCNGLICILINRRQFFLWNPSTRMSKKLPSFDNKVRFGHIRKFGFGFDDANGDYMVFGFLTVFLPTGKIDGTGKVYSLNTNSWRLVKEKEVSPFDECGKFASGKLHWGRNWGLDWRWDIFSFDLMSGVHGKVDQPSYTEDDFYPTLGVLDGCICVICKYRETRLDVWILKEYGVKESWNRVAIVPYLDDLWKCRLSIPCCIGRNGEIVFAYGSIFLIYYPKDNEFRHPEVVNYDEFSEVNVHIESLVSLPT